MKKVSPEQKLKDLVNELTNSFMDWSDINDNGCNDPAWPDGCNMNLVRNHILYYKSQIKELCEKENIRLPAVLDRQTPPETDNKYMAQAEAIRVEAHRSLALYQNDPDYKELAKIAYNITSDKRHIGVNILGYMKSLERAIKDDDLVVMRRHRRSEGYLKAAHNFITNLQERDLCGQQSFLGLL